MRATRRPFSLSFPAAAVRGLALILAAGLWLPATPVWPEDAPPPDPVVGTLDVALPSKPPARKPPVRLVELAGPMADQELDWHAAYVADPTGELSPAARTTLAVATTKGYDRAAAVADLKNGGDATKRLYRNLDVGRHEALKHLYHRAMVLANAELAAKGLSPLPKLQAVNAGGTGDYSRDQDITVFAGDEVREKAYFDALLKVARDELHLRVVPKETGGFDMPEIEVTLFPGQNDLPDARFATDVEEFHLKYRTAIEKQAADPEAYKGGGADIEVKGRRKPGAMYVQQFEWKDGRPVYVAETPQNCREARSIFQGTGPERFQRFERAAHAFSDYIQGRQHAEGEHHDLTKGPLKYSGRSIDQVCEVYDMKPWAKLAPVDRVALLHRIWPEYDPKTPYGARMLERIGAAIDVGVSVKTTKRLPEGMNAAEADQVCLIFMRRAVAATGGQMAAEMLDPPAFDQKEMRRLAGPAWDRMTPAERHRYAKEKDAKYRACVGRAGMENLLVLMSMLRQLDLTPDGKPAPVRPGADVVRGMLERADPRTRPLIELASEYAEVRAIQQRTSDPKVRAECDARMGAIRKRMVAHVPQFEGETPGQAILSKAARTKPQAYVRAEMEGKRRPWSEGAAELEERFAEHLKEAFPTHAEEWKRFRAQVDEMGMKGYVARRLFDEAFQLDTLADGLTLVEMYQGGAGWRDYGAFLATNLVSRIHWGVGPLIQAFQVHDADPEKAAAKAKELGKSLVFQTLARVVPWAATAKVVFDVGRGVVTVTVGWAVGQANAELVDALYTGEAGRTDDSATGTVRGAKRESGFAILSPQHVIRAKDPDTGELRIGIDRGAVYRDFFRKWTGLDPGDVPRASAPAAAIAAFVKAHDDFVRVLERQTEQFGPTWVRTESTPFVPFVLTTTEVEDAIRAVDAAITARCGQEAASALDAAGIRAWKRYGEDASDTRHEELTRRFAADVLSGMIEHWQTALTAQVLAARDIERVAAFADQAGLAEALARTLEPSPERRPPVEALPAGPGVDVDGGGQGPREGTKPVRPAFELDVRVDGVDEASGEGLDGGDGVRVSAFLRGRGEVSDTERPVKIVVETSRLALVSRAAQVAGAPDTGDEPPPVPGKVGAGDLAEDRVVVRALAADGAGPELARYETKIRVRIPTGERKAKVAVRRHEDRGRDGRVKERYTYVQPFDGMPKTWVTEGGVVYHGEHERLLPEAGRVAEVHRYQFGTLDGATETFDGQGRLVHRIPYAAGKVDGLEVRFDPDDSASRLELRYEKNVLLEQTAYGKGGVRLKHVTYVRDPGKEGEWPTESGRYEAWWPNGNPKWRGSYEHASQDYNERGEPEGGSVRGKTGTWEWFHENGRPRLRTEFRDGLAEGASASFDAEGQPLSKGAYHKGLRDGVWETYEPGGRLKERRGYREDRSHGIYESYAAEGYLVEKGQWEDGKRAGVWEGYWPSGKVARRYGWKNDEVDGPSLEFFEDGSPRVETAYRAGKQVGRRKEWSETGKGTTYLSSVETWVDGVKKGEATTYWPSGAAHWTGSYVDDKRAGRWKERYESGSLRTEGAFVDDKADGPWPVYGEDGKRIAIEQYQDGLAEGRWETYDAKGRLSTWTVYRAGEKVDSGHREYKD